MKLFTMLALVLTMAVGCTSKSPEEKKEQQEASAQKEYQEERSDADHEYKKAQKDEAKAIIDEGGTVKQKKVIEVDE